MTIGTFWSFPQQILGNLAPFHKRIKIVTCLYLHKRMCLCRFQKMTNKNSSLQTFNKISKINRYFHKKLREEQKIPYKQV
jgi:hypothetical protein